MTIETIKGTFMMKKFCNHIKKKSLLFLYNYMIVYILYILILLEKHQLIKIRVLLKRHCHEDFAVSFRSIQC